MLSPESAVAKSAGSTRASVGLLITVDGDQQLIGATTRGVARTRSTSDLPK